MKSTKKKPVLRAPSPKLVRHMPIKAKPPATKSTAKGNERTCDLCEHPMKATDKVLVIAGGKLYRDKKALAVKNAQFTAHAKCWSQIENEDI